MTTTASDIQQIYVAYFNRPADVLGLQFWVDRANANGGIQSVISEFANSKEYTDAYAGKSYTAIVDQIYMNLFGRHAEAEGLVYWALKLQNKEQTFGQIAYTIANSAQNDDLIAVNSKVAAATAFTTSLDTAAEILGYDGAAANAVAKAWLSGIVSDATLAAATTDAALAAVSAAATDAHNGTVNNPMSLVLTTGVDTIVGGAGNDTITASNAGAASTLTGLDTIDGGAGKDTLVISDVAGGVDLSLLAIVKNVESATVTSTGALAGNAADISGWTGLTSANFALKSAAKQTVTAADTTAVTVSNTAGVTVAGGSSINVTAGTGAAATTALATLSAAITVASTDADITTALDAAVAASAITAAQRTALETAYGFGGGAANPTAGEITAGQALITGYTTATTTANAVTATSNGALASATVKGGSTVTITDGSTNSDQLKSVSLDSNKGAAALTGDALATVSVANSNQNVTINVTGAHAETVTLTKVTGGTVQDATATTLNIASATTKSSGVTFSAAAATKVNVAAAVDLSATVTAGVATSIAVTGAGKVTLAGLTAAATAVVDASGSTGGVTVTPTLAVGQNFIGGAGKDAITIGATTKSIVMGAGDDTVTLTGALGVAGKVDAGTGVDTLAGAGAVMAAISVADAGNLTGFETFKITDALVTGQSFDVSQVAGVVNFVAGAGVATTNTAAAVGLGANATVSLLGASANDGTLTVSVKTDTAADIVNVILNKDFTVNDDATADARAATINLVTTGIETVNVNSTGTPSIAVADLSTGSKADVLTNTLALTDNNLVTLKVTGDQILSFTSAAGMTKLATIDASGNTAGVVIDDHLGTLAATIKGTAKADVITGGPVGDTITGGGGNDTFKYVAGASSIGTGKFDTITDFVANTYGNAQSGGVDTGGAGTGANATASKLTGDVLNFTHVGTVVAANGAVVDVLGSAADASTYLANHAGSHTVTAALDSSGSNLYVDVTDDGVADFYIHLTGVTTITAAAFTVS